MIILLKSGKFWENYMKINMKLSGLSLSNGTSGILNEELYIPFNGDEKEFANSFADLIFPEEGVINEESNEWLRARRQRMRLIVEDLFTYIHCDNLDDLVKLFEYEMGLSLEKYNPKLLVGESNGSTTPYTRVDIHSGENDHHHLIHAEKNIDGENYISQISIYFGDDEVTMRTTSGPRLVVDKPANYNGNIIRYDKNGKEFIMDWVYLIRKR